MDGFLIGPYIYSPRRRPDKFSVPELKKTRKPENRKIGVGERDGTTRSPTGFATIQKNDSNPQNSWI